MPSTPTPESRASQSSSLAKRHRSGSRSGTTSSPSHFYRSTGGSNSLGGSTTSLTRPTPSRSKSSTPQPKVLPFPGVGPFPSSSRDGSRATSPTFSPLLSSHRGSQVEVTALELMGGIGGTAMSRETSDERGTLSGGGSGSRQGSWGGTSRIPGDSTSPTGLTPIGSPTSPPVPSPLRIRMNLNTSASTSHLPMPAASSSTEAGPSRFRASTNANHSRPNLSAPINTSTSTSAPTPSTSSGAIPTLAAQSRIQGFYPSLPAPTVLTSSATSSPAARPSSLPTSSSAPLVSPGSGPAISTSKDLPRLPSAPPMKKNSNATPAHVLAVPIAPAPATASGPLGNHLYSAFTKGFCADVRLWVRKWGIGWKVHKMVLVQAGFFNSLFLGGFSETSAPAYGARRKGKEKALFEEDDEWAGEDIELQFDDPNITRAAFEICLSRLYSSYPFLHFPVCLLPTASQPLTPSFTSPPRTESLQSAHDQMPVNTQLATPRLLLSLLATTIYLGHGALMREVLSMVLRTVGPMTVCRYINFATGAGAGDEEWEGQDEEPARGLEEVGQILRFAGTSTPIELEHDEVEDLVQNSPHGQHTHSHRDSADSIDGSKVGGDTSVSVTRATSNASSRTVRGGPETGFAPSPSQREFQPQSAPTRSLSSESTQLFNQSRLPHFYGFASNKIGEACACWLARWGIDILNYEVAHLASGAGIGRVDQRFRIWGHGGIPAKFVRAVLSSDALFVRDEMERYLATRRVLDLRMSAYDAEAEGEGEEGDLSLGGGSQWNDRSRHNTEEEEEEEEEDWEEEESEIMGVFADGIYYTHMTFEDLSTIATDIDPETSLPYAPLNILQAAHWSAANLKSQITFSSVSTPTATATSSTPIDTAELGVTQSTSEIISPLISRRRKPRSRVVSPTPSTLSFPFDPNMSILSASASASSSTSMSRTAGDAIYHPIPTDDTHRIGAGGLPLLSTAATAAATANVPSGGAPDLVNGEFDIQDPAIIAGNGLMPLNPNLGTGSKNKPRPPHDEKTCFGLARPSRSLSEIHQAVITLQTSGVPSISPFAASPYSHLTSNPSSPGSSSPAQVSASASGPSIIGGVDSPQLSTRWSKIEPFRFSVEFFNVHLLAERERAYSSTHFYAGSWFNVYVQTIRKKDKGVQLGVYLHRQNPEEPFPVPSAPSPAPAPASAGALSSISSGAAQGGSTASATSSLPGRRGLEREAGRDANGGISIGGVAGTGTGAGLARLGRQLGRMAEGQAQMHEAAGGSVTDGPAGTDVDGPGLGSGVGEEVHREKEGYKDERPVTKAYFSISCASALGTALIRFSSAPDSFTLSQSWGWKSSALRTEEYLSGIGGTSQAQGQAPGGGAGAGAGMGIGGAQESLEEGVLGWVGDIDRLNPGSHGAGAGTGVGAGGSLRASVVVGVV